MNQSAYVPGPSWFRYHGNNRAASRRLFCFNYAGAGASMFRAWPALLPAQVELVAVQLPGREDRLREPPVTRLQDLVSAVAQQIQPLLDKPFAFFGHSMGALLAFELARDLVAKRGISPFRLFVSGRKAPHLRIDAPPLHALPEDKFVAKVKEMGGTDSEIFKHPEMVDLILPILRADFEICETYQYRPGVPLPCRITAMGGTEDAETPEPHLQEWQQHGTGDFALHMLHGNHFFINAERTQVLRIVAGQLLTPVASERPAALSNL